MDGWMEVEVGIDLRQMERETERRTRKGGWLAGRLAHLLDDPGGIDHDVYGPKVRGHLGYHARDRSFVPHVDFVELHGDAGARVQLGGGGVAEVLLPVQQGDGFGTGFGERLGHVPA